MPLQKLIEFVYYQILTPIGLPSFGLAIILVTILIRLLLYPLTRKQMQSMKKMQAIQPKMKEIQEKYGKDREKLAQKQMELYKQEGVNPAGGCLPLLIQMPFLFAFYYALLGLGSQLDQPFLWIPSLAFPSYGSGMGWLQPLTPAHLLSPEVSSLPGSTDPVHPQPVYHAAPKPDQQPDCGWRLNKHHHDAHAGDVWLYYADRAFWFVAVLVHLQRAADPPAGIYHRLEWHSSEQEAAGTGDVWRQADIAIAKHVDYQQEHDHASASPNASTSVISSTGELDDDMGAGRRRKMRKKKR